MDIEHIAASAAAKLDATRDAKVGAVRDLAGAGLAVQEATALLASAEQDYARTYAHALRSEWTEKDLKDFGFDPAARKTGGRPRKAATRPAPVATSPENHTGD
ncbi:hypothetical protein [Paenarthrobacter histidinolovorans]|uniref:Uncharacterized protein n=1 Tax=Paenarthrobacter histidinolovorans TaxID=43664 RepID=A0ABW8MZF9_9MICC